jgi:hypothetical protein
MSTARLPSALALVGLLAGCHSAPPLPTEAAGNGGGGGPVAEAGHGGGGAAAAGAGGRERDAGSGGAVGETGGAGGLPGGTQTDLVFGLDSVTQLDLLFMVDNSSSMTPKQEGLARGFPAFMNELVAVPGGLPDLHIAIISSNFGAGPNMPAPGCPPYGDKGRFLVKPGCGLDPASSSWLQLDGKGVKNFVGNLPDVFGCMARLGVNGCGYEHQLQALRAALYDVNPENRGFLRPEAALGIFLVTDEDDCSAEPYATIFDEALPPEQAASLTCSLRGHVCNGQEVPARDGFSAPLGSCRPYERPQDPKLDGNPESDPIRRTRLINVSEMVDFIKAKKPGRPDRLLVSAIMGWDDRPEATYQVGKVQFDNPPRTQLDNLPICRSLSGSATAGVRLKAFVDAFGENGSWYSICQDDLTETMRNVGRTLATRLGTLCVPSSLADADPNQPGQQLDCAVLLRRPVGASYTETPVPACTAGGARPCWSVQAAIPCATHTGFVLEPGTATPPPGSLLSLHCR